MRIVQIVPEVRPGSGVEAVAFHLEQEWRRAGLDTSRFTLSEAAGGWLPQPGAGLAGKLALAVRVLWFSTVGTALARRMLARQPAGTVAVCHNDALAGDVYVNHGIVAAAMQARGHGRLRMVRNPLHLFTWARDRFRYASRTHRVVVNLTVQEEALLQRTYRKVVPRTVVIGNGVDVQRFRPDPTARRATRAELGLSNADDVAVFVGHEFARKGLPLALQALALLDGLRLVVVGGTSDLLAEAATQAEADGVGERVTFVGRKPDPSPYLQAADLLVFPSAYEAYPLVVLEALACGVPVVATPVGSVPELIVDGVNGAIVEPGAESVAAGIQRVLNGDREALAMAARATAEEHSWSKVSRRYLALLESLAGEHR